MRGHELESSRQSGFAGTGSAAVAAVVALVCYAALFHGIESVGFVGPDEPRYAAVARDMAASGDWVTPRLHGEPWLEKPILYYWLAGAGHRLLGDREAAARLPSAFAALLATLALAWAGHRLRGASAALIVAVLFPTTVAAVGFARAATPDMLFASALGLSMVAASALLLSEELGPAARWQAAFGAAMGLAVLAKGPAGIVLAGGSLMGWGVAVGEARRLARLVAPAALVTFVLVAAPWYLTVALRNPGFFREFIVSHNVERFLTPVFRHEQPVWFFVPVLLLAAVPWTPALGVAARDCFRTARRGSWRSTPATFHWFWVAFPLLFFSVSRSKLPGYILPAVPPLALIVAFALADMLESAEAPTRSVFSAIGALLIVLGVAAAVPGLLGASVPGMPVTAARPLAAVLVAGGLVVCGLAAAMWPRAAMAVTTASMVLFAIQLTGRVMPRLDASISPRVAAAEILATTGVEGAAAYRLQRGWRYGFDYYLRTELPEWRPPGEGGVVITNRAGIDALAAAGFDVDVLIEASDQAALVAVSTDR